MPDKQEKGTSYRKTKSINLDNFKQDILSSDLITQPKNMLDELVHQYNQCLGDQQTRTINGKKRLK